MTSLWSNKPEALKIALCAGEASGDLLGAHLIDALKASGKSLEFAGIGGPLMIGKGLHSIVAQERLAVRGYVEVLRRLPELMRIRKQFLKTLLAQKPDVFIGIDAPDFNLWLEKRLKKAGIKTIHYVSPSIWAWRAERIYKMKQACDAVLCLFPMEPPLYEPAKLSATYVGHPLAHKIAYHTDLDEQKRKLAIDPSRPVVTLMPGSRMSELKYMAPLFLKTAAILYQKYPNIQFLVPLATQATFHAFDDFIRAAACEKLPITKMYGHAQLAILASDTVLVTSGTATLEVALCKRAMVISYKISPLTYWWVKNKIKRPVGLPNILLGKTYVPELLQSDANAPDLAQAVADYLDHPEKRVDLQEVFLQLHHTLDADTASLAPAAIFKVMESI